MGLSKWMHTSSKNKRSWYSCQKLQEEEMMYVAMMHRQMARLARGRRDIDMAVAMAILIGLRLSHTLINDRQGLHEW